jgi:hypothetical protein
MDSAKEFADTLADVVGDELLKLPIHEPPISQIENEIAGLLVPIIESRDQELAARHAEEVLEAEAAIFLELESAVRKHLKNNPGLKGDPFFALQSAFTLCRRDGAALAKRLEEAREQIIKHMPLWSEGKCRCGQSIGNGPEWESHIRALPPTADTQGKVEADARQPEGVCPTCKGHGQVIEYFKGARAYKPCPECTGKAGKVADGK